MEIGSLMDGQKLAVVLLPVFHLFILCIRSLVTTSSVQCFADFHCRELNMFVI